MADFDALGTTIIAASVDSLENARKTISRHEITFPVAYGLDPAAVGNMTGAFWDPEKGYLHATGFMIRPDGKLAGAVYSTGPVGRYRAEDTLGLIQYLSKMAG